jgi:predicted nucleic acid-binding protein
MLNRRPSAIYIGFLAAALSAMKGQAEPAELTVEAEGFKKWMGTLTLEVGQTAVSDLRSWTINRPAPADVMRACRIQRDFGVNWWDALIVNSATELGCDILWTEELSHGQQYGPVTVRNPFTS